MVRVWTRYSDRMREQKAEGRIDVTKGFLEQRQRVQAQPIVQPLHKRTKARKNDFASIMTPSKEGIITIRKLLRTAVSFLSVRPLLVGECL
jgi:hypothetical protein